MRVAAFHHFQPLRVQGTQKRESPAKPGFKGIVYKPLVWALTFLNMKGSGVWAGILKVVYDGVIMVL